MAETKNKETVETPERGKGGHWIWPLTLALASLGGAAAFLFRGCWHSHMSWPIRYDDEFSYQACTSCGIKRLFDVQDFVAYGPYGYDVEELISRARAARIREQRRRLEAHEGAQPKPGDVAKSS